MAHVEGLDELLRKFGELPNAVAKGLDDALGAEVLRLQQDAVDLIPERTGNGKAVLARPEAIKHDKSPDTGGSRFTFGFITPALRKAAYYLFWVEFGTKGHPAGEALKPGKTPRGGKGTLSKKVQKRKRAVPARRAQPFFRQAVAMFSRRFAQKKALEQIAEGAKRAVGFISGI